MTAGIPAITKTLPSLKSRRLRQRVGDQRRAERNARHPLARLVERADTHRRIARRQFRKNGRMIVDAGLERLAPCNRP